MLICFVFNIEKMNATQIAVITIIWLIVGMLIFVCNKKVMDKNEDSISTDNTLILDISKTADFIVNGYAFTSENNQIRVLNLNDMNKATVLDINGEVLMTSMDDIEISIVKKYFERNKEFLKYNIS